MWEQKWFSWKPRHQHGKSVNVFYVLHPNLDTESDSKYFGTKDASTKHHSYND